MSGFKQHKPLTDSRLVQALRDLKESYFADDYDFEYVMTRLDNLNLMYVAFTRARDRLYIITPQKGNRSNNINGLLTGLFENNEWFKKHRTGENVFEIGKPDLKIVKKDETKATAVSSKSIVSVNFHDKIVIRPVPENIRRMRKEYLRHIRGLILHLVCCLKPL
jgi:ATP-dependent exoDNAse (exonuclease V) beta subunit